MGKVVLKSVQDRRSLKSILKGEYRPDFNLSYGAFDEECTKSYKYMLDKLSTKTGEDYIFGKDTCMWAWYQNPFFKNHINYKNLGVDLVVITFEIDESQVVFSDFDAWCERIVAGWGIDVIVDIHSIDKDISVQAVCWDIPVDGILNIEPFSNYENDEV